LQLDEMEIDILTIPDIEDQLIGKFSDGTLEVTGAYYSPIIDRTKDLGYLRVVSPFYFDFKQKMKVEADSSLKISAFWIAVPREGMSGKDLFNQLCNQTKLDRNSFYLTIMNGDKPIKISRNSASIIDSEFLVSSKLNMKKLTAGSPAMTIQVEIEKRKAEIKASPDMTIRELVEAIDIATGIPSSTARVIYDSEILNHEHKTLKELGIKDGEKVSVLRGSEIGVKIDETVVLENCMIDFVDIANEKGIEKRQWSDKAPKWRMVKYGLSVEGICKNANCEANGKYVIINKEIGKVFDLHEDYESNKCPICSERVVIELCAFNNCLYTYVGKKYTESGKPAVVKSQDWKDAGDEYNRYNPEKSGMTKWFSLKISTRELPKDYKDKKICPICEKRILEKPTVLKCKHEYHSGCVKHSLDLQSSGTTDCVLCSEPSTITSLGSTSV